MAPVCAISVLLHLPVSGSQIRRVLSAAADTSLSSRRVQEPDQERVPLERVEAGARVQVPRS